MPLDYQRRLQSLQNRRFDNELNESALSKLFSSTSIPPNIKYLMESMRAIDKKYNDRTIEAAERVKTHLESNLNLHFKRAYRAQGSVTTLTNIKVHSDYDLLTIVDRYFFVAPDVPNDSPYTETDPNSDIKELRKQSEKIMTEKYDIVDKTGVKSISIFNKNLSRKVDIVFCFWYNIKKYEETKNEYYRGINLFDFQKEQRIVDYPFAHISAVNDKGSNTNDGSKKAIRLLKNLKADSNVEIGLSSFHLTTIIHSIENSNIFYYQGKELNIAKETSKQLGKIISDDSFRKSIESPNGTEKPLQDDKLILEMQKLKSDLDLLIEDVSKEFYYNYFETKQLIYS